MEHALTHLSMFVMVQRLHRLMTYPMFVKQHHNTLMSMEMGLALWESSKADKFEAVERAGVGATHRGLLKDERVFELIQSWLGVAPVAKSLRRSSKVVDIYPR
ncbi:hypothetical protein Leryth_027114 [Lithospermum erythrorhizon]|nr:hypothetical protein Leryth_027114 [Lithospermum erythrorhizon]